MKISIVNMIVGILSGIKINKIEDKRVKSSLLKDYLVLRKAAKEADDDKNEIIRKFSEDWQEELAEVDSFRRANKPVVGHKEYLDAERDANKAIQDILDTDVEIADLSPVKMDAVLDFSDNITFEQVAFLQECGVIE